MDKYRECWKNRPVSVSTCYPYFAGGFATFNRFACSNFYGNMGHQMDMFDSRGTSVYAAVITLMNANEFGWNTLASGNEQFAGLFYDPLKDHTEPKIIINEWVPRACRVVYGKDAGNAIAPLYQSGIQPMYIVNPGRFIAKANKKRRKPLADMDPNNVDKKSASANNSIAADIIDDAGLMAKQVKAAEASLKALDNAYEYYSEMPDVAKKMFTYFYRRMPRLYAIAKVRYATRLAANLQKDGMYSAAAAVLQNGIKELAEDEKLIAQMDKKSKGQKDIKPIDRLKWGKLVPIATLKTMLSTRLADANVVLKPRRAGKYIKVGIYAGTGQKGTLEYFEQFKNVKPEIINSLNLAVLDKFDCVFVLKNANINKTDFFFNLRQYVEQGGGGVIIEHDLIGGPRSPFGQKNPFPEVCKIGSKRKDCFKRKVKIVAEHPALGSLENGDEAKLMYVDFIVPVAGDNGTVLVADNMDEAVVVAGEVGFGKVIFSGTISFSSYDGGYSGEDIKLYGLNAELAKGFVEWSTGVMLEKK
jgi:predicted SnoaL-like aldol condensation-catalyzing enzyme